MNNVRYIFLALTIASPLLVFGQRTVHFGISILYPLSGSDVRTTINSSTHLRYGSISYYGPRFSILNTHSINDRLALRTGLEGQRALFYGRVHIFQDQPGRSHYLPRNFLHLHLNIPLEARYRLTDWLYIGGGLGVNILSDVSWDTDLGTLQFGLTAEERDAFIEVIDKQIKGFNFSYQASSMIKYRQIGLKFGYTRMFTNILKPFRYEGIEKKKSIRYGEMHLNLFIFFDWADLRRKPGTQTDPLNHLNQ